MILIGWLTFLLAALMNILFYKVHPSFVDFKPKRFKERCFIYLFGKKIFFLGSQKGNNFLLPKNSFKIFLTLERQKDPEDINVRYQDVKTSNSADDTTEESRGLLTINPIPQLESQQPKYERHRQQ